MHYYRSFPARLSRKIPAVALVVGGSLGGQRQGLLPLHARAIGGRRNIGLRPQICLCANMQFLHRTADPGGLDAFTTALQRGVSNEQVALILMGSAEYFARV